MRRKQDQFLLKKNSGEKITEISFVKPLTDTKHGVFAHPTATTRSQMASMYSALIIETRFAKSERNPSRMSQRRHKQDEFGGLTSLHSEFHVNIP